MQRLQRSILVCLALVSSGCSEEIGEPGSMLLVEGADADAWTAAPPPITVDVEKVFEDGGRTLLTTLPAPVERFSLGRGAIGSYVVSGKDDSGVARARALSLPIDPTGFAESAVPLFVSRTERFSRAPAALSFAQGERPVAAVVAGRYLFSAGGSAEGEVQTDAYDLGAWTGVPASPRVSCPSTPCTFSSIAVVADTVALAIGDTWAIWFDIESLGSGDQPLPEGLTSWADVAGGQTINAPDGTAFIVGATRAAPPSRWVIEISPDGAEVSTRALLTERAGAAAAWVDSRGLVVVGGDASGTGAGVELLAAGSQAFVGVPHPADATTGAGLAALDGASVVRAGGRDVAGAVAPTVDLALGCATCAPVARAEIVSLDRVRGFSLGAGELLFVGDDATGETTGVRLGAAGMTPTPLRVPRKGGSALAAPTGHVAVLGGSQLDGAAALEIELFAP
jgi:hypothetical protein